MNVCTMPECQTSAGCKCSKPFMPVAHIQPDAKIETTWSVLEGYRKQIADRDAKIADLVLERDALARQLASPG